MDSLQFLTYNELVERKKRYIYEIRELYKILDLIPETTFLGILSIKSSIKKKRKHLHDIAEMIKKREDEGDE